ncbi:IclR family transcriptional regulator [Caenimonas soli]|uniref:IclR family transcriptional regulator n=1 Tax=Caenimonas soli TaxID=2735555 RepID=UPI00155253F8|nr:IclR family transcriptional regulator [Caenimonas soli]NPC57314.1 IclR family transcriptional regulator [Caenimonas soli]
MAEIQDSTIEKQGSRTLRRGLSILKLLARYQPTGLGVSDMARKLQLDKATTLRLARTLMDEKFLAQDASSRRYQLGPEAFAVGLAAEPSYALQRIAAPSLRALALETGDWVFFSVRHGLEVICLSRANGDVPYPHSSLKVGDRHPLGLGAGGLSILAAMPDDEVDLVLSINADAIAKQFPSMTVSVIRKLLQETRERGYCSIPGILVPGYWGVGVPLLQRDGRPVAAIVLIASASRLSGARQAVIGERLQRLSRELMNRAHIEIGDDNQTGFAADAALDESASTT